MLTGNGRIGLWTMIGLAEHIEEEADKEPPPPPNKKSGGLNFTIDAGEPPAS